MVDLRVRGGRARRPVRRLPPANPGVDAVNGAVAGGAGSNAIVELAKRLQQGDPPDVWQTFAGKSVQGYARRGVVRSVASVFEGEDLRSDDAAARSCGRSCATASRTACRPARTAATCCGSTRSCSRRPASRPRRAATPSPRSWPTSRRSRPPARRRCASAARTAFTTVELFENTLLSSIGTRGWKDMVGDELDWRSDQVQTALKRFGDDARLRRPGGRAG